MKNSDEALDRVLAGLREGEAPVGMEARVLARMNAARPRRNQGWAWGLVAAGVVLGVGLVVAHRGVGRVEVARVPEVRGSVVAGRELVDPTSAKARRWGTRRVVGVGPTHRVKQGRDEWGTRFASEVSLVAPPMPLTEQERLAVEVARRGVLQEVPVLNPDELARHEAAAEVQFQQLVAQTVDVEQFVQITRKNGERR